MRNMFSASSPHLLSFVITHPFFLEYNKPVLVGRDVL